MLDSQHGFGACPRLNNQGLQLVAIIAVVFKNNFENWYREPNNAFFVIVTD